ncbi:hypothetical protein KKI24_02845 [bacterium]|nr:hypothetical protein [bacterium]
MGVVIIKEGDGAGRQQPDFSQKTIPLYLLSAGIPVIEWVHQKHVGISDYTDTYLVPPIE